MSRTSPTSSRSPTNCCAAHFSVLTYRGLPCGCGHRSIVEHLARASCRFARLRRSVAIASASLLPPLARSHLSIGCENSVHRSSRLLNLLRRGTANLPEWNGFSQPRYDVEEGLGGAITVDGADDIGHRLVLVGALPIGLQKHRTTSATPFGDEFDEMRSVLHRLPRARSVIGTVGSHDELILHSELRLRYMDLADLAADRLGEALLLHVDRRVVVVPAVLVAVRELRSDVLDCNAPITYLSSRKYKRAAARTHGHAFFSPATTPYGP